MNDPKTLAEKLSDELRNIADLLANERCRIFQQEVSDSENVKEYVDSRLFSLQSQIRDISEIVVYMDFKKDNEDVREISVSKNCNGCLGASFGDCQRCERERN